MLITYTLVFSIAWWLGLYLIGRNWQKATLLRAGLGLLAYGLALACAMFASVGSVPWLGPLYTFLIFLPVLCWSGALVPLLPLADERRERIDRWWLQGFLPFSLLGLALALGSGRVTLSPAGTPPPGWLELALLTGWFVLPLAIEVVVILRFWRVARSRTALGLAAMATIFFGLGLGLVLFPLAPLPTHWVVLAIGFDMGLLGIAIALLDAFDEGETLRYDMIRSFIAAALAASMFGIAVAATIVLGAVFSPPLIALLLTVIALAIAGQTLADPFQALIDRLAFPRAQALQQARAELRESVSALPKIDVGLPLADLDEAEFTRLTRRALSHYGDLGRLAANPLTQLPVVEARLHARGAPDHPLERAAELKSLLAESIARLKPREQSDFGTSDAWRYYNALYFPYVAGIRPYSRRTIADELDPTAQKALAWFAAQVPERTLHNWQNAAARLVAADIRVQR
jgi:hypothetical protein